MAKNTINEGSPVGSYKGEVHSCTTITELIDEYHQDKKEVARLKERPELLEERIEKGEKILEQLEVISGPPEAVEIIESWVNLHKRLKLELDERRGFTDKWESEFVDEKKKERQDGSANALAEMKLLLKHEACDREARGPVDVISETGSLHMVAQIKKLVRLNIHLGNV